MMRWLAILLTCLIFNACQSKPNDTVVVVDKTKIFHRSSCPRVSMANTRIMSIQDALALHFKPCPDCRPGSGGAPE